MLPLIGVTCSYQILAIYKASTYVSEHLIGLTTSVANMIIMLFGYLFHMSIGNLVDISWSGTIANNQSLYTGADYTLGLSIIPAALFAAAMGYLFIAISERRVKAKNNQCDM